MAVLHARMIAEFAGPVPFLRNGIVQVKIPRITLMGNEFGWKMKKSDFDTLVFLVGQAEQEETEETEKEALVKGFGPERCKDAT